MAESDKKISQLDAAASVPIGTLFVASLDDGNDGYISKSVDSGLLASEVLSSYTWPLVLTKTSSKSALGALAEISYKELTGTLTTGSTSIVISDASITTSSTIDIFADVYGVSPESVTVATGSVTMTWEARESDLSVKVRVY